MPTTTGAGTVHGWYIRSRDVSTALPRYRFSARPLYRFSALPLCRFIALPLYRLTALPLSRTTLVYPTTSTTPAKDSTSPSDSVS